MLSSKTVKEGHANFYINHTNSVIVYNFWLYYGAVTHQWRLATGTKIRHAQNIEEHDDSWSLCGYMPLVCCSPP